MYGLKVEENTPLARLSRFDRYQPPDEDANVAMYFEALGRLQATGFRRYEFSNLARPGYESRHNLNYWDNGKFMALGVSAHGYWQGERYETVRDLGAYLANPTCGERHVCSRAEQLENALIFGLRKAEGVDIAALEEQYGIDFEQRFRPVLDKYIPDGFLLYETGNGKRLMLSEKAIPVSNAILAEFLSD
jgi:oxygen-independent coproporphyrinogen III oxidase